MAVTLIGALLVATALRDMFHTLWHPSGRGAVSRAVMRLVWRVGRRWFRGLVGPVAVVAVVGTWAFLTVVGWTLVYWPHMPGSFSFDPGLLPADRVDLIDSIYLSLVTVGTLGFGDIVPEAAWLRLVTPLQALVGFALLTAAVSWILQVYPALGRRRAFASRLSLLRRAEAAQRLRAMDSALGTQLLTEVVGGLVQVRVDLAQYSETYYFRDADPRWSLAAAIDYTCELAAAGRASGREEVRLAADVLQQALEDFSEVLNRHVKCETQTVQDVLTAYAADHGHPR